MRSGNYSTNNSPTVVFCLSSWCLYLCSLVFRNGLKRTSVQIYYYFHLCFHSLLYSAHQISAGSASGTLISASSIQQNHLALLGSPLLCFRKKMPPGRMPGCSFILFVSFLSLREHSTARKTVISYMLCSFLAVYYVRESLLLLQLPTWLQV